MRYRVVVPIDAPAEVAWRVLADLERWPTWTDSMTTVERVGTGVLAPGLRVKVKQPKMRQAEFEVTAVEVGRSFRWVSEGPGITSTATHEIATTSDHRSEVTLTFEMTGWLGGITGALFGRLIRRYVQMEANGLAEASARAR